MEFPDLGKNCSEKTCNKLDFLPMKCDACLNVYCGDHFRYEHHGCEVGVLRDVQVPVCPLCAAPVPGKRGDPPDIVVSAHIDNDCQTDAAKQRRNKVFTNRCASKGCKGKEMVPLICSDCSLNFCFKHRHGQDHQCEGKLGAKRRRAAEAALARSKAKEESSGAKSHSSRVPNGTGPSTTRLFTEVQGHMSEDEALARALSLSLQDPSQTDSELLRNQPNRQRVGGEQSNPKCTVS